ncbi:MAG: DUF3134 domain-containing protein [Pseudanabaenales cyanobacterium]|nr:DUF3134 domain-containing protein [Pseudanabaenales cyanobacterium]
MYNPSLRQFSRQDHATVIPVQRDASILAWLEKTGRLIPRDPVEPLPKEENSEEISDLMGGEDSSYDDDDDLELDDDE